MKVNENRGIRMATRSPDNRKFYPHLTSPYATPPSMDVTIHTHLNIHKHKGELNRATQRW